MDKLKGQDRLNRIGQLQGDICNLRHELDGIFGYPKAEKVADRITNALLMKEILLCAAENGIYLDDNEALEYIHRHRKTLESVECLDDALTEAGLIPKRTRRIVTTVVKQGLCPVCGNMIELDELLSPFVTQYPEIFRYHCPTCGTTGTQTVTSTQNYPVRHSNVIDGSGCPVFIKEPTPDVEPTIPISVVKNYLVGLLDEWDNLGERKYELPNVQVYNHIRTELDDLRRYCKNHGFNEP